MLVIAFAAAFLAAGTATGDPSVSAKQAQAKSVMVQLGNSTRAANAQATVTKLHRRSFGSSSTA